MTLQSSGANYRLTMEKRIIITIGRQFGSGGKRVAEELGRKLGIPVYDQELIKKAAQDSGFSAGFFEQSDEKRRIFSLSSIFADRFSDSENYMSDKGMFKMQCETIRKIAEQGSAVIIGRCSDYVLRDMEGVLNVFITSPIEARMTRISERLGISPEEAEEVIGKKDKGREEYYNYYTFGNWGVASTYDICLDSSKLGIEGTADFIISYARKAGLIQD